MHLPAGRERRKESLPASVSFILRCALPVSRIGLPSADRNTWPPSRMVCGKQAFQNSVCTSPIGPTRKSRDVRFSAVFGGTADIERALIRVTAVYEYTAPADR